MSPAAAIINYALFLGISVLDSIRFFLHMEYQECTKASRRRHLSYSQFSDFRPHSEVNIVWRLMDLRGN